MVVGKGFLLCWQIFSVMRGTATGRSGARSRVRMESFAWPRLSGGDRDIVRELTLHGALEGASEGSSHEVLGVAWGKRLALNHRGGEGG